MPHQPKILYVTRDIERALGMEPGGNYRVIANRTPYAETVRKQYPHFIDLVEPADGLFDTAFLLENETTAKCLAEMSSGKNESPGIMVFKNNSLIESIAKSKGWKLLNPSAELSEKVENKVTQIAWMGDLGDKYLPSHSVGPAKDVKWGGRPIIIQWAHGHTGDGTILVNSAKGLKAIQKSFPDRPARVTDFVNGPSFTANVVVVPVGDILVGNISYQITGLPPFTDSPFTTIGNDWSLPHSLLDGSEISEIETMARDVGLRLQKDGWRGLFGIDVMKDIGLNKLFLIEINARQPASTTFESFLQEENRRSGIAGITTFEAHVQALTGQTIDRPLIPINDGAQVIQRVTKKMKTTSENASVSLGLAGYRVIEYVNDEYNTDLLRIQSMKGIMESHGKWNKRGKEITEIISN